jgi:hypothetical protein
MHQTDIAITRTTPDETYVKYSHHSMKAYGGVEAQLHALDVTRQVHVPAALSTLEAPLHGLSERYREQTSYPYRESNSGCLAVPLIA